MKWKIISLWWIVFYIRYSILFRVNYRNTPNSGNSNPPLRIYVNKTENRITFKTKTGYYLEILRPETMKLLGNAKSKINKKIKMMKCSLFTEVVLVYCGIVNTDYQRDSGVLYTFVPNKSFG